MKRIVVLSGAGVSAESGIPTFRDSGGLWEGHNVEDVATPDGWHRNPKMVLDFYNERRKAAKNASPNPAHLLIADLQNYFDVVVVTQNIDNLHENAGSTNVIHLHGSIFEARSSLDHNLIYPIDGDIKIGDKCEKGSQLRPNVVWFGEMVPAMDLAMIEVSKANIMIVIGTSLQVYPAAGLLQYASRNIPKYIIDPNMPAILKSDNTFLIEEVGSVGMKKVHEILVNQKGH